MASQATSITAHVIGGAVEMVCEMKKKPVKISRVTAAKNLLALKIKTFELKIVLTCDRCVKIDCFDKKVIEKSRVTAA